MSENIEKKIDLFEWYKISLQNCLISYHGPIDRNLIVYFSEKIRQYTEENPKISKKIISIFIELAQNVSSYSDEKSKFKDDKNIGIGTLVVGEYNDKYIFGTGNIIDNQKLPIIEKRCEIINSLDREQLRDYKRQQRNLLPGTNGNAHIGLIMIALITRKKLDIKTEAVNRSHSYFSIMASIDKNNYNDLD